jgi:hypothetical protein
MFGKSKVSQSMIDAVNKVLGEQPIEQKDQLLNEAGAPIKEPTPTGVRVYGSSYGNSAKAKKDQTKSPVDNLKGPKAKELQEAPKPDFLDMDKDGNKKEPMKKAITDKKMEEELKGNQDEIDANNNDKIDAQDFKILRGKKKVKEGREFTEKLLETVRKSDVPAYLRKAKGDTPLTMADVKAPKKDSISAPENLAKARNETYDVSKIAPKPFKSEPKPFKGDHDSLKSDHDSLKRPKLTTGLRQSKISPGETEVYIKNSYEFEQVEHMNEMDKSQPSQERHGDYPLGSPTGTPAKPVKAKKVVKDLTKLLNKSFNKEEVEQIDEKDAPEHTAVKPLIHIRKPQTEPAALIHRNPTYPGVKRPGTSSDDTNMMRKEEVELHESLMGHIEVKPARKHKDPEILAVHDVHYKGKKIGDIEVYHHRSGMKYGSSHDATGNSTAGHRTMDQAIDDIRQEHAQHLKSMKEEADITTDTLAGRSDGGKDNSFKKFKVKLKGDGIERPMADKPESTPSRSSIKAEEVQVEATIAGISGFKPMKQDVKDKSGAVHTPMSRAKDLARQAFKTVQNKTKVK